MASMIANKPMYVVVDTTKIRHENVFESEDAPLEDLIADSQLGEHVANGRVTLLNPLFELTPKYDNVVYITERGQIDENALSELVKQIANTYRYVNE